MALSLQKLCEQTDTHGVRFLADPSIPRLRRLFWFILVLGSIGFLGYLFEWRIRAYLDHEVTTRVSNRRGNVHLPSVRLCIFSWDSVDPRKLSADDIVNAPIFEYGYLGNLGLNESAVFRTERGRRYFTPEALQHFQRVLATNDTLEESRHWFSNSQVEFDSHLNWKVLFRTLLSTGATTLLQSKSDYNESEVLSRVRHQPQDLIMKCRVKIREGSNVTTLPCDELGVRWKVAEGCGIYCMIPDHGSMLRLEVVLYRPWEGVMFPNDRNTGYWTFVESDVEAVSNIRDRRMVANTEFGEMVAIRLERRHEHFRLGDPFVHCEPGDTYSRSACVSACIARKWATDYGCRNGYMSDWNTSIPVCEHNMPLTNDTDTILHIMDESRPECFLDCPDACHEVLYSIAATNKRPTTVSWDSEIRQHADTAVSIVIESDDVTEDIVSREVEMYPLGSMLAELGGTMGLFIGISLLSIAHCLEFSVLWFITKLTTSPQNTITINEQNCQI